jgi:hypothetical protein
MEIKEANPGNVLYAGRDITVSIPQSPNIPLSEGLHISVKGIHDREDNPKAVLRRFAIGQGVAKVVAESGHTGDFWANTRIEKGREVNIYGRRPEEPASWRKPVDANDRGVEPVTSLEPFYKANDLARLFSKYIPMWEKLAGNMNLFDRGIKGKDLQVAQPNNDLKIWENEYFDLLIIRDNPHLNGFHLFVGAKNMGEAFERQWQTVNETADDVAKNRMVQRYIQATVEATAIAMGARHLIAGDRGEIHISGNWAEGLKTTNEGGKLSLKYLRSSNEENLEKARKEEKRKHFDRVPKVKNPDTFKTSVYVHVYIPESGDKVILPEMKKKEAEMKLAKARETGGDTSGYEKAMYVWETIRVIDEMGLQEVIDKLSGGKLEQWLIDNCQGPLVP